VAREGVGEKRLAAHKQVAECNKQAIICQASRQQGGKEGGEWEHEAVQRGGEEGSSSRHCRCHTSAQYLQLQL